MTPLKVTIESRRTKRFQKEQQVRVEEHKPPKHDACFPFFYILFTSMLQNKKTNK